jgi:DNA-binding FadR family transcriptional regulator
LPIQRIRSSYVQVAEQLRELIVRGDVMPGHRLPSEAEMAPLFGVSRSTIREALRILVTDGLVETRRGVRGGTFVVDVDPVRVEGLLHTTLNLLAITNRVGADDFLDAWQAIEAPAAVLAAGRIGADEVEQLRHLCAPGDPAATPTHASTLGADFHSAVLRASGNLLLEAMGRPVAAAARARFSQTDPSRRFWETIGREHQQIADAIAAGDGEAARAATIEHIDGLRGYYRAHGDNRAAREVNLALQQNL